MVESINLSEKMLQASAEVLPATPHVSTLFWGTSAELLAVLINTTGPATAGPVVFVPERRASMREPLDKYSTLEIQGEISAGR